MGVEEDVGLDADDDPDARTAEGERGEVVRAGREHGGPLAQRVGDELVDGAGAAVALGELGHAVADAEDADRGQDDDEGAHATRERGEDGADRRGGEDRPDGERLRDAVDGRELAVGQVGGRTLDWFHGPPDVVWWLAARLRTGGRTP